MSMIDTPQNGVRPLMKNKDRLPLLRCSSFEN